MACINDDWEHQVGVNPLLQDMNCGEEYFTTTQDLLVGQSATAPTTTSVSAQSPLSETNPPPSLSPNGGTQPGPLSPGALSQTSQNAVTNASSNGAAGSATGTNGGASGTTSTCCENGRPIMNDPVSGQTICSCQYDSARLALSSYSRLPSAGVYGTPYPSTDQNPYPSIGVDSSAFYSPLSNPYGIKDSGPTSDMSGWTTAGLQPTTYYSPYDPTFGAAAYGYGAGYDLAARRKNATRESTATLKAWLNEHKKNPYPTKGEKIMLAIITKMTLTQVSTWFANARRRLKKENKMTWEPKNKTDDDDDAMVSDDEKDKDDMDDKSRNKDMHHHVKSERDKDDDDDLDDDRKPGVDMGHHGHHGYYGQHPMAMGYHSHHGMKTEMDSVSKNQTGSDCGVPIPASKPKIWSLADTAACKTPPPHSHLHPLSGGAWAYHQQQTQHPSAQAIQYSNSHNNNIDAHLQQQSQMHHQNLQSQQQAPQHLQSQQQIHHQQSHMMSMGQGNTSVPGGMTMSAHQQPQQAGQQMNGMSGMMNTFGGSSPYSRYGGFLAGTHPTQQQPVQQHHQYINSNNPAASTTPVTPNSTGQPTTPTLQQQQQNINSQTSNNQTMGFPEIQTDTPPQTPPNMKFNTTANTTTVDTMNNNGSMNGAGNNNNTYIGNFRVQQNDSSTSQMMNQMADSFKPFYKNNQQIGSNNNYVSPV